jgi:hypothetical protein
MIPRPPVPNLEDETGCLPLAMAHTIAANLRTTLRDARYLVAIGRLERVRWYRSLWAFELIGVQRVTRNTGGGVIHSASL